MSEIKVIFNRVYVIDDADWFGSGEFYFIVSVDGRPVGDRHQIFNAVERQWINLPAAQWSAVVDVRGKNQVIIRFEGKDEDLVFDDDLGSVTHTLRPPWQQRDFRHSTRYYTIEWSVEVAVEGRFGRHLPNEVYACREHAGSLDCTTVSGVTIPARMEFHPVRPVPPAGLPPRPPLPAGTPERAVTNTGGAVVTPTDPINIIPNPSVIPILSPPATPLPLPANAPPVATDQNSARIEFTYYRPDTLAFTDNDPRLVWSVVSVAGGGNASFVGPAVGLKVMVYGTSPGEVRLEVRFRGELFATYRALVMRVKQTPCRFNILNGPDAASTPRSTPANILDHLAITNRFLRQMGLELVLDTDPHTSNNATATATPGIFRIRVSKGTTFRIDSNVVNVPATILNHRPNVMNFAYIKSERRANVGGAATDFPASNLAPPAPGARPTITDSGTPSTSWISPTGVAPDAAATPISMTLINAIQRPGHPRLFAMFVADLADPSTPAGQQQYAKAIVHELGHILNLGHRVEGPDPAGPTAANPSGLAANGIFWDGLQYPPTENIMNWQGVQPNSQDLDIIQTRGAHQSPLVPP